MFQLLVFAAALSARLGYRRWQLWVVWALSSLAGFIGLCSRTMPDSALAAVVGMSALGFIAPELWQGLRRILSHPRTVIYLIIGGAVVLGMTNKAAGRLLSSLVTGVAILGIILIGLRTITRGLTGGGPRRRR